MPDSTSEATPPASSTPAAEAVAPVSAASTADKTYIIQYGDTLSEISARFGVSVDTIAIQNQIRDVNVIYAGSALVIPAA